MNTVSLVKQVLLITSTALLATGCVVREQVRYRNPPPRVVVAQPGAEVVVTGPPPPAIVEGPVTPPDATYVWIPGAYFWVGRWEWRPGHYDHPPRRGQVWLAPHYEFRGGRHIWIAGGWR